ncbi:MAG: hypothetical protein COV76_04125 [Candidatus Omnitrophica bacterium CG11_big_fil_rev_8_21_14_0_20_64_10]|nr:MAG: hypothetical protein COV76_04125 [Candidatus Omnitrophica bacterium CG11_big_fil_rev_8_21_14_0_20_64_10]
MCPDWPSPVGATSCQVRAEPGFSRTISRPGISRSTNSRSSVWTVASAGSLLPSAVREAANGGGPATNRIGRGWGRKTSQAAAARAAAVPIGTPHRAKGAGRIGTKIGAGRSGADSLSIEGSAWRA